MESLIEGKAYSFYVDKILTLPDNHYFLLIDEWNRKYLLPTEYYKDYNISPGKNIICYVNKINCNGKIFLEPEHPIYRVGDVDIFKIYTIQERIKQKTKEPYYVALANNEKTNKAAVINHTLINSIKLPLNAECKVIKIKKAEVLLEILKIL